MTPIAVDVRIRPPLIHELSALATLLRQVFAWAYGSAIPAAQLASFLDEAFAESALAADLARSDVAYHVAAYRDEIVGVSRLQHGPPPGFPAMADAIELAKCYVSPNYHGQGVAAALLAHAITLAQVARRPQIWLCVWEQNPRAVAFYRKHGFVAFGTTEVWVGDVCFIDLLMARETGARP